MVSIGVILLIVGCCFYLGIIYTNPTMVLLGYTLSALLLVSVVELVYRFFTVKCFVQIPIAMAEQNAPVAVTLRLRNRGLLPIGKVAVKVCVSNSMQSKGRCEWVNLDDVGIGETTHVMKLAFRGAGCHEVEVQQIKVFGLLGIGYIKKKSKDYASVLILPEVHFMSVRISQVVRNFVGDADIYDEHRSGDNPEETFEIREYRPKDKLQSIHWKLSAKMDELMVKENSLPKACAIVLLLDMRTEMRPQKVSAYLELVASLSFALMDMDCPHYVAWYSREREDIRRIRIDSEEAFYLLWDCYLREVAVSSKNLREEYRQKYRSEWYLHDLSINEKLELSKNGEFLCQLDGAKIKDACEKLEILF